jgi:hydrogenase expression/formation protein HypE
MGNEGKAVIILPEEEADKALDLIRKSRYGEDAALIGRVERGSGRMILENRFGGKRTPGILRGEGLPRIC